MAEKFTQEKFNRGDVGGPVLAPLPATPFSPPDAKPTAKPKPHAKSKHSVTSQRQAVQQAIGFQQQAKLLQEQPGTPAERAQEAVQRAQDATREAAEKAPGNLAVRFKSGACCLYAGLGTSDYIGFTVADSQGKWLWRHGCGAPAHPSYSLIAPDPSKILAEQPVVSSWAVHAYLIAE